jgi:hypothetical protein
MTQEGSAIAERSSGRFGTLLTALVAGLAGGLIAPLIAPGLARSVRPATKTMFKAGIGLYERGREKAAELGETASDLLAEARTEYDAERALTDAGAGQSGHNEVVSLRGSASKEASSPNA